MSTHAQKIYYCTDYLQKANHIVLTSDQAERAITFLRHQLHHIEDDLDQNEENAAEVAEISETIRTLGGAV